MATSHELSVVYPDVLHRTENSPIKVGSLAAQLHVLHPESQAKDLLFIQRLCQHICVLTETLSDDGFTLCLTGSDSRRLLGGTPETWDKPSKLWRLYLDNGLINAGDNFLKDFMQRSKNDVDIRFLFKDADGWDELEKIVEWLSLEIDQNIYLKRTCYGNSTFIRISLGSIDLDLGELPRTKYWGEDNADNCRMSIGMPNKSFMCVCYIDDEGMVYTYPADKETLLSETRLSYGECDIAQAMRGALMTILTEYFWPPQYSNKSKWGFPAEDVYNDPNFWKKAWENTNKKGRGKILNQREPEIIRDVLVALCDPSMAKRLVKYHILDQLNFYQLGLNLPKVAIPLMDVGENGEGWDRTLLYELLQESNFSNLSELVNALRIEK